MPAFYVLLFGFVLVLIGASLFVGAFLIWMFSEKQSYAEPRRIICPENLDFATVAVDGKAAARTMVEGHQQFPIADCSRWPKMRDCDQACSVQVPLVADDRTKGEYAPFGLTPHQIRVHNPVRMTARLFARMTRQQTVRHLPDE